MESPHTGEHSLGPFGPEVTHCQPTSTLQFALQPSFGLVLSSSHFNGSVLYSIPSPHISEQVSGAEEVPPEHDHPTSTSHSSLHPSALSKLLSSHCSPESLLPLAHARNTTSKNLNLRLGVTFDGFQFIINPDCSKWTKLWMMYSAAVSVQFQHPRELLKAIAVYVNDGRLGVTQVPSP